MPFGTIPLPSFNPSVEPRGGSETVARQEWDQDRFERAWERLEDSVVSVTMDKQAFMRLEQGLPLAFIQAVDSFARLCGPFANAYLEQTRALRIRITEFDYECSRQGPLFASEVRAQEQRATVEHMLDMLRDPGYARLMLQEMALRQTAQTGDTALARAHGILPDPAETGELSEEERARQARFAYLLTHRGHVPRYRELDFSSEPTVAELFPDVDREIRPSSVVVGRGRAVGPTRSIERASTLADLQRSLAKNRAELTPPSELGTE